MVYIGLLWSTAVLIAAVVSFLMLKDIQKTKGVNVFAYLMYPMSVLGVFNMPLLYGSIGHLLSLPYADILLSYWWHFYLAFFLLTPLWIYFAVVKYTIKNKYGHIRINNKSSCHTWVSPEKFSKNTCQCKEWPEETNS